MSEPPFSIRAERERVGSVEGLLLSNPKGRKWESEREVLDLEAICTEVRTRSQGG